MFIRTNFGIHLTAHSVALRTFTHVIWRTYALAISPQGLTRYFQVHDDSEIDM
jgi:hypothetical protein